MSQLRDQRGQSLVEAAVALPVLLLLTFGLIQFGLLAWQRVMLQHAVYSAARAYTVWQVEEPKQALPKAERAAWLALRGTPQPRSLQVSVVKPVTELAFVAEATKTDADPDTHRLMLQARWNPLIRLPFWRDGFSLTAQCGILSESPRGPKAQIH